MKKSPSLLKIRRGVGEKFTVWSQYCCLAVFDTFDEAAAYVKKACCYALQKDPRQLELF